MLSRRLLRKKRAVSEVLGALLLMVVVIIAVGSFSYFLSTTQQQAQNRSELIQDVKNENLQVTNIKLSPNNPLVQWEMYRGTSVYYVQYEGPSLVSLNGSSTFTQLANGEFDWINSSASANLASNEITFSSSGSYQFRTATWESLNFTIRNLNTAESGIQGISVDNAYVTQWYQLNTAGGIAGGPYDQSAPMIVPAEASVIVSVNFGTDFATPKQVQKTQALNIVLLTAAGNYFQGFYSPPNPVVIVTNTQVNYLSSQRVVPEFQASASTASSGAFIQDYIWQVDVPNETWANGNWDDVANIATFVTTGSSFLFLPEDYIQNPAYLSTLAVSGPLMVTLTTVDSNGLMTTATPVFTGSDQGSAPPSSIELAGSTPQVSPGNLTVKVINIFGQTVDDVPVDFAAASGGNVTFGSLSTYDAYCSGSPSAYATTEANSAEPNYYSVTTGVCWSGDQTVEVTAPTLNLAPLYVPLDPPGPPDLYPLPKSPPITTGHDFYYSSCCSGGWGGSASPLAYTITSIQGLLARTTPILFLNTEYEDGHLWYPWLTNNILTGQTWITLSPDQVVQKFAMQACGNGTNTVNMIVYNSNDPEGFPTEANVARTLAGVFAACPVASNDLTEFEYDVAAAGGNVHTLYDLRNYESAWSGCDPVCNDGRINAYEWAWNLVGNQVTRSFLDLAPQGIPSSNDYTTEFKAFVYGVSLTNYPANPDEVAFTNEVLNSYSPGTPVIGFFGLGGEVPTVTTLSQRQMYISCCEDRADYSMYSAFPTQTGYTQTTPTRDLSYDPTKKYVVFMYTQGDAFSFNMYGNVVSPYWTAVDPSTNVPYIDEFPVNFMLSPILAEAAPPVLDYWYATATNYTYFISGHSAGMYEHPDELPDEAAMCTIDTALTENAAMPQQSVSFGPGGATPQDFTNFINSGCKASALWSWNNIGSPPLVINGNIPVFFASYLVDSGTSANTVCSAIQNANGQWIQIDMNVGTGGMPLIKSVIDQCLGGGNGDAGNPYIVVRADEFLKLWQEANSPSSSPAITTSSIGSALSLLLVALAFLGIAFSRTLEGDSIVPFEFKFFNAPVLIW